MQSVSSRIWTRVAASISYDDNDYTTGTSRKSGEHLRTTYGNTGQLFRPYYVSSSVYTMIPSVNTADET